VVTGPERDAVRETRVTGEKLRVDLDRGDGSESCADLADELVIEERRQRRGDLGLEYEPPSDESFAFDDVEVAWAAAAALA
jgi:hypothetical protein